MSEPNQADDDGPKKYSPFEVKELLIEFAMRHYPRDSMTTNLKDDDLDRAMSFEPDGLEAVEFGAPVYVGTDLFTAIEDLRYEAGRNDFLLTIGVQAKLDQELQRQMTVLLNEESKQLGYSAEQLEYLTPHQQILNIASARIKLAMLGPEPQAAFASRDHFDFTVLLTTLRGGYAGTTQTQRLYFNFPKKNDTLSSYVDFLALLQDASQLSVIPPLKPGEPYRTSGFTSDPPPRYGENNDPNVPANALGVMQPTPPDSFTTEPLPEREQDTKGYTILDGPWIYTIKRGQNILKSHLREERDRKLDGKVAYDNMVQLLKDQKGSEIGNGQKSSPSSPGTIVVEIIHSMDRDAIDRYREEEEATKEEETQFRADAIAQGLTDDDIGVPFGAYLKNSITKEKEDASRAHRAAQITSTFERSLKREEEILRATFFSNESSTRTQPEFDAEMEKMRLRLKKRLDHALNNIPKDTSGF